MRIAIFGDSIAQGFYDIEHGGWANLLSIYLQKIAVRSNYAEINSVFNLSVSGQTSTQIANRFKAELETRLSDKNRGVIIIAVGINDAGHRSEKNNNIVSINDLKKNYKNMITIAKEQAKDVFVLGLTIVDESLLNPYPVSSTEKSWLLSNVLKYNDLIKNVSEGSGAKFISLIDFLSTKHLIDGLHPSAEGHRLIFEQVKRALEEENIL